MIQPMIQPTWWTDQHASQWDNLKVALERDWEQTKADLHLGGHDLHQNVTTTLNQAAGAEPIPAPIVAGRHLRWDYAEVPLRYGVGARSYYGLQHVAWGDDLESRLKNDWITSGGEANGAWLDVRVIVRHGYEYDRS